MWLILTLWLTSSFDGLSGHETLCTSNACFTLHMDRLSFGKARESCVEHGGHLMTVRDREEEEVLRSLLSQIQTAKHPDRELKFWIGLRLHRGHCVISGKTLRGFQWVSGEGDSHYSNWEKEPVHTCTSDRCVSVRYSVSGENALKWTDGACKGPSLYVCQFYFKGMCKPLALLGPGQITYTAPFSAEPQNPDMQTFPMATYADILCSDQQRHYSVCLERDAGYNWNNPGPFCRATTQTCDTDNGGCQHLCLQDSDGGVRCACKEGYSLAQDAVTCSIKDLCDADTCEHLCVMGEAGYFCKCPHGFKLDANQRTCSDIDECQSQVCEDQLCLNSPGSYSCTCKEGYKMMDGECVDIDECAQLRCDHSCSNSAGSFSCHCDQGFTLSQDGYSCEDINECDRGPCQHECVNIRGSFLCTCPQGSHLDSDGSSCAPDGTEITEASSSDSAEEERHENVVESLPESTMELQDQSPHTDPQSNSSVVTKAAETDISGGIITESLTGTTVELQHQSPHTDAPPPGLPGPEHTDQQSNTSVVTSFTKSINSRVIICVLGSVVPLVVLIALTLAIAIFRCSRIKKEAKKNTTADGYCWVSSGLDPRLEKLYESIKTDDL